MPTPTPRTIISIYGPSGAGKSQLAKALVEHLGSDRSVRIPTDYYLASASPDQPLQYDWALLTHTLALPNGTATSTPDFDFTTLYRRALTGGRPITMRPIAILDAISPYPHADLSILLTVPAATRRDRIIARDATWGTRVIDRWQHLEATYDRLESLDVRYALVLSGTNSPVQNVAAIAKLLCEGGIPLD